MAYQQTTVYKRFEHKLCDNSLGASTCSSDKPVAVQSFMAIIYLLSLQTRKVLRTLLRIVKFQFVKQISHPIKLHSYLRLCTVYRLFCKLQKRCGCHLCTFMVKFYCQILTAYLSFEVKI